MNQLEELRQEVIRQLEVDFIAMSGGFDESALPHQSHMTGQCGLSPRQVLEQIVLGAGWAAREPEGDPDPLRVAKDLEEASGASDVQLSRVHHGCNTLSVFDMHL